MKHLLLALSGKNPQVITETLYVLMVKQEIPISEVHVLTTEAGKRLVVYGSNEGESLPPLKKEIERMCSMYSKVPPLFDPNGHIAAVRDEPLDDVREARDNLAFTEEAVRTIRRLTSDTKTVLHCCLAGGRKTMSVAAAFALSLFGRPHDKLYHMLVSPEFEKSKKYFPEQDDEAAQLVLSEIPYIRLREKLPLLREHPRALYSDLVAIAQQRINEMEHLPPLIFETATRSVHIGGKRIAFQPFDFAFYFFVARQRRPVLGGKRFSDAKWKRLLNLYEKFSPSAGHTERVRKTISGKEKDQRLTKSGSVIRHKLRTALGEQLANYYAVASEGSYADVHYRILLDKQKIRFE